MAARVAGLRSALVFRNAPATEPDFKVSRTALDLAVALAPILVFPLVFPLVTRVDAVFAPALVNALLPAERFGAWRTAKERLPPVLGCAIERPVLGRAKLSPEWFRVRWTAKERLPWVSRCANERPFIGRANEWLIAGRELKLRAPPAARAAPLAAPLKPKPPPGGAAAPPK